MRRSLTMLLTALIATLCAAGAAQAVVVNDQGTMAGVALVPGASVPKGVTDGATAVSSCDPFLSSDLSLLPSLGLCYHGGPVMHANETFALTWDPNRLGWAGTRDYVEQFLKDAADGSGTLTSPYAVTPQYHDAGGAAGNKWKYGGACIDLGDPGGYTCQFGDTTGTGIGNNYPSASCTVGDGMPHGRGHQGRARNASAAHRAAELRDVWIFPTARRAAPARRQRLPQRRRRHVLGQRRIGREFLLLPLLPRLPGNRCALRGPAMDRRYRLRPGRAAAELYGSGDQRRCEVGRATQRIGDRHGREPGARRLVRSRRRHEPCLGDRGQRGLWRSEHPRYGQSDCRQQHAEPVSTASRVQQCGRDRYRSWRSAMCAQRCAATEVRGSERGESRRPGPVRRIGHGVDADRSEAQLLLELRRWDIRHRSERGAHVHARRYVHRDSRSQGPRWQHCDAEPDGRSGGRNGHHTVFRDFARASP